MKENTVEDLLGLSFAPADLFAIIAWSEEAARWGVTTDIETAAEAFQELLCVTLADADEPAFALWTTPGGLYCLEDYRPMRRGGVSVETTYANLGMAFRAIETAIAKCGRALRRVAV